MFKQLSLAQLTLMALLATTGLHAADEFTSPKEKTETPRFSNADKVLAALTASGIIGTVYGINSPNVMAGVAGATAIVVSPVAAAIKDLDKNKKWNEQRATVYAGAAIGTVGTIAASYAVGRLIQIVATAGSRH